MRYQAKSFSQLLRQYRQSGEELYETLYAVWDWKIKDYVMEPEGVWVADKKAVQIWAKYLNDNLSYEPPLSDKPLQDFSKGGK